MSKKQQVTRQQQRNARREQKQQQQEQQRLAQRRRTIWISTIIGTVAVVVTAIIIVNLVNNAQNSNTSSTGKGTSTATSALVSDNPSYPVVDNIACQSMEQLAYHIHAHISIYINGSPYSIPANLGIAPDQSCYYWIHTHDTSGIIHIESPTNQYYVLGTFFKEWNDGFSSLGFPAQLNTNDGWKVYVDGKLYTGDFHQIQLLPHRLITMAFNSPGITPDTTYNWGTL